MAKFRGNVTVSQNATDFEMKSLVIDQKSLRVSIIGELAGQPFTISLTAAKSRTFMQQTPNNQANGEVRKILQKACLLAINDYFSTTLTVNASEGVDDEWA